MIGKIINRKPDLLEPQINAVLRDMSEYGPGTPEFEKDMEYLERLNKLKTRDRPSVSGDTIAIVLGNLAGILIIVMYEQKHVLSTKAFGFGMKRAVAPN
jgi:hypothetical protein